MRILILFVCITLTLPSVLASQSGCEQSLTALLFMKTNLEINAVIKEVFPKLTKRRDDIIEFNLVPHVTYIGISYFKNQLRLKDYDLAEELVQDWEEHKRLYHFDTYIKKNFLNLIPNSRSDLFLTFSEPIDNYLVANLVTLDPEKFGYSGPALYLFFKFDDEGVVEEVLHTMVHLN